MLLRNARMTSGEQEVGWKVPPRLQRKRPISPDMFCDYEELRGDFHLLILRELHRERYTCFTVRGIYICICICAIIEKQALVAGIVEVNGTHDQHPRMGDIGVEYEA